MSFKATLIKHANDVREKVARGIANEDETKQFLIKPFLAKVLEYDLFGQDDIKPELAASVQGKNHKVDYGIMKNGKPAILVEAKAYREGDTLGKSEEYEQLSGYFLSQSIKGETVYGVLTNGVIYKFYDKKTSSVEMEEKPFLDFNLLLDCPDDVVIEVEKFHKEKFDPETFSEDAARLKRETAIKDYFATQLNKPTPQFIKYIFDTLKVELGYKKNAFWSESRDKDPIGSLIQSTLRDFILEKAQEIVDRKQDAIDQQKQLPEKVDTQKESSDEDGAETGELTAEEREYYIAISTRLWDVFATEQISHTRMKAGYLRMHLKGSQFKTICDIHKVKTGYRIVIPSVTDGNDVYLFLSLSELHPHIRKIVESAKERYPNDCKSPEASTPQ